MESTAPMPGTVEFMGLPTGPATLTICAYAQRDGLGSLLAEGESLLSLAPGVHSNVTLTLIGVPDAITVNATTAALVAGETAQCVATVYDALEAIIVLPSGSIEWSVTPSTVATITQEGLLTAVGEGQATVIARVKDTTISGSFVIDVVPPAMVPTPSVAPMADAWLLGEPYGAVHLSWPVPPTGVIAVLVYRSTNPSAPIAILEPSHNWFVDSANLYPTGNVLENTTATVSMDTTTGVKTIFDTSITYESTLANLMDPQQTLTDDTLQITCRRMQLTPGFKTAYHLRWLYNGALTVAEFSRATGVYALRLSSLSPASQAVTNLMPPVLVAPDDGVLPLDSTYQCATTPGADSYTLQISNDPSFPPATSLHSEMTVAMEGSAAITIPLANLIAQYGMTTDTPIFWRMGARKTTEPLPATVANPNYAGWVYSEARTYIFPAVTSAFSR
ncbi:MAG: Bacterial Ig-like domain (group 2) [bacterium ADurb.Bin429]|nr:MAG: Bacterial Ig-like domain (group 2) [bacterium ADurb.Bin429]